MSDDTELVKAICKLVGLERKIHSLKIEWNDGSPLRVEAGFRPSVEKNLSYSEEKKRILFDRIRIAMIRINPGNARLSKDYWQYGVYNGVDVRFAPMHEIERATHELEQEANEREAGDPYRAFKPKERERKK